MHLAYIDAGSGSLIIQALVAGAAGVAVFLKLGWRRITGSFRRQEPARSASAPSVNAPSVNAPSVNKDAD